MTAKKFAISIPEDVMGQVDQAAAERGVTRSRFISDVLRRAAQARSDREITRQLSLVFADPEVEAEHRALNRALLGARSNSGTEW